MPLAKVFRVTPQDDFLIIQPQEPICGCSDPTTNAELEALLGQLRDPSVRGVVLDMERLPYFGTYMLEAIYRLWQPIRSKGGKMVLCHVSVVGKEILRSVKFDKLWPIAPNIQEALQILQTPSPTS